MMKNDASQKPSNNGPEIPNLNPVIKEKTAAADRREKEYNITVEKLKIAYKILKWIFCLIRGILNRLFLI